MAYANVEPEKFVHMLGGDRTAFQRSVALLEGERGQVTRELNQAEIELWEIALELFKPVLSRHNFYIDEGVFSASGQVEYAPGGKI